MIKPLSRLRIRLARWLYPDVFGALNTLDRLHRRPVQSSAYMHIDTVIALQDQHDAHEHVCAVQREIAEALHG